MSLEITYQPWGETLAEVADASRRAEAAGATVLWNPEMHRSATISAAVMAEATETAGIGTGIALAFTRSPMITALEALDLDELSGGRFILGLGTGVQRLNESWHNAQWGKPVAHLRETVRNIRAFVATCTTGQPIELEGDYEPMHIRGFQRPFVVARDHIPIYLAAMGPVMTRTAAEIGDGWISHELCSPAYLAERIMPDLETGLAKADKNRSDFKAVVSACCSIHDDRAVARERVAGLVGFYASVRTYADFFDFHGLADEQAEVVSAFRSGRGADYLGDVVSDRMVETLTLCGPTDEVAQRIASYEGVADAVKLSPPTHGLPGIDTRDAQNRIIDLIATITRSAR